VKKKKLNYSGTNNQRLRHFFYDHLAIFCNPISDLEFSFIYRNNQLGFEVYTKKKAATSTLF
jgi:hypothetical protein